MNRASGRRWRTMALVGALAALLGAGTGTAPEARAAAGGAIVMTDAGLVRGTVTDQYRTFQGIPYAAPPVGELRWKSPQPVRPWVAPRDATKPGSACPQTANPEAPSGSVDEDCLYLNVTTPRGPARPRPVLVWMPGGGFYIGAGSSYDAHRLAVAGDVVVVTVNYRLGIFGFFGYPGLSGSGTFGLQDQQAALRWVRRNAAAFGGDPRNVTLLGESAGAMSTCAQLTSPSAAGLFDKAVMQSGSCDFDWPAGGQWPGQSAGAIFSARSAVAQEGPGTAAELGCPDPATALACLRRLPATEVIVHHTDFVRPAFGTAVLPENPARALAAGRFHRVPVISGNNHDEATSWLSTFNNGDISPEYYQQLLVDSFGDQAPRVARQYPVGAYPSPAWAWAAVTTDRIWSCNQQESTRALAKYVPAYGYDFAGPFPKLGEGQFPPGATHAAELAYLFDLGGYPADLTPEQRQLADTMIGYWTRFARTGDPNGPGLPRWGRFTESGQRLAPGDVRQANLSAEHHCDFWSTMH